MVARQHQVALDACILAYQTYHQSLLWPLDPWYEALARMGTDRRTEFLGKIRESFFDAQGKPDTPWGELLGPEHGDTRLDPVLTRYKQFNPKLPAFTVNPGGSVVVLRAPAYLTDTIVRLRVSVYEAAGRALGRGEAATVHDVHTFEDCAGADQLVAFEGATGHDGPKGTKLWSIMGCVLRRQVGDKHDLYISFRGSRSGDAGRAAIQGVLDARGNADWVTDTANKTQGVYPEVAKRGKVGDGFARSVISCFGSIEAAVRAAAGDRAIRQIYVTGHSLGGGLAGHFVSAVSIGAYGVGLRERLPLLPWDRIKGIAMAMPPLGDEEYRRGFDLAQACGEFSLTNIWVTGDAIVEAVDKLGKGNLGFWSPGIRIRLPLPALSAKHTNTNPHEIIQIQASLMTQTAKDPNYEVAYPAPKLQWGYFAHWGAVLENSPSSYTSHVGIADVGLISNAEELRAMLKLYQVQPSMSLYANCLQEHFNDGAGRISRWMGHAEAALLVMLGRFLGQVATFEDDIITPLQVILANPEGEAAVVAVLRNEVDSSKADTALNALLTAGSATASGAKYAAQHPLNTAGGIVVGGLALGLVVGLSPLLLVYGAVKRVTGDRSTPEVAARDKKTKNDTKVAACDFYVVNRVWLADSAASFVGTLPQGQYQERFGRHRSTAEVLANLDKLKGALMTAKPKPRLQLTWQADIQKRLTELEQHKAHVTELRLR